MSLSLDAFKEASKPRRVRCSIMVLRDRLSAKDRDALDRAMGDESITHAAIEQVLSGAGHDVRQQSIARHRRGGCTCPKEAA